MARTIVADDVQIDSLTYQPASRVLTAAYTVLESVTKAPVSRGNAVLYLDDTPITAANQFILLAGYEPLITDLVDVVRKQLLAALVDEVLPVPDPPGRLP